MSDAIFIGGRPVEVPFPVVNREGVLSVRRRKEPPVRVVLHVDMTFRSLDTEHILKKRGLSTHFGVDGDGDGGWATVWQWADPMLEVAFHAGPANDSSIGIDVNTPLALKYTERDAKKRGRRRPVIEGMARGKLRKALGLFPEQLRTLFALGETLRDHAGIQMKWFDNEGQPFDWEQWHGWIGHNQTPATTHHCPSAVGPQVVADWIQRLR